MTLKLPAVLLSLLAFTLMSIKGYSQTSTATITTDQPDYAPRSTAVFTGSGFQPGENVVLKVKNLSYPCNTVFADSSYTPWTVTADVNGSFVTNWTVCDCAGDSLKLRATGQTSGLVAYALFSDAGSWSYSTTSGKSDNVSLIPGASDNSAVSLNLTAP